MSAIAARIAQFGEGDRLFVPPADEGSVLLFDWPVVVAADKPFGKEDAVYHCYDDWGRISPW